LKEFSLFSFCAWQRDNRIYLIDVSSMLSAPIAIGGTLTSLHRQ